MPCKQIAPTGNQRPPFRTGYKTEAECLQACKEGACCEGTTCSVKPQCQCGGVGKTFKGVGTTCNPNPCLCCTSNGTPVAGSGCQQCWCFCGEGAAVYPRFINVSLSGSYKLFRPTYTPFFGGLTESGREWKDKSLSCNVTLSVTSTPTRYNCPSWTYGTASSFLSLGNGGATGCVIINSPNFVSPTSAQFGVGILLQDLSEYASYSDWRTSGAYSAGTQAGDQQSIFSTGVQTSGTCFSDITVSFTASADVWDGKNLVEVRALSLVGSITGVQA